MSKKSKTLIVIIAILILLLAIILIIILTSGQDAAPPGDLLGAWAVEGNFIQPDAETNLLLQINEFAPAADGSNTYRGAGCLQTGDAGGWAPLSLQADYDAETASYTLNMLSTLVAPELDGGAAVIRLVGAAEMGSAGVKNDRFSGTSFLSTGEVAWSGVHTGLETVACPAWDKALSFLGEFGLHRDLAYIPPFDVTNFHGETNIVSFQMRAEAPDGEAYLADYQTDIFSPEVNFIDQFRFDTSHAGAPLVDQPYHFALLDVLGVPLPGAEDQDTFRRCDQGAATDLRAVVHLRPDTDQVDYVELVWDAPEIIPGYFDPANGNGFYQLILEYTPWRETDTLYGSESLQSTHHIPWNSFEPGAAGFPDGHDYGISLAELEDGQYILFIGVFSYYDPPEGESGFDCRVQDSRQGLFLTKQGNQITVQPAGAISGFIYDTNGNPLENVAVAIDGLGTGFHEEVCSQTNGYYLFTRLPLDSFTLSAGGFGSEDCPGNSFATLTQPDLVLDGENPIREGVDIILAP
jgi:hypothetical protein